ncbi:MAG TPA: hypothetical protein VFB12_06930 [Ktedonobacteraceae bacterium]|nr:hypothetical protein [Ktedonobacteraceae bacterium]
MKQWNTDDKGQMEGDLDKRLAAYYGPQLREQPLSQASWQGLHRQLKPRKKPRLRRQLPFRKRRSTEIPASVQDACARVAYETRSNRTSTELQAMLRCKLKNKMREPAVHVSVLPRPRIKLSLPLDPPRSLGNDALDVLVATGLARYRLSSQPSYLLTRLLFVCIALAGCIEAIIAGPTRLLPLGLPIAMAFCACSLLLLGRQKRKLAIAADAFVVQWLGRGQTCRGLHALADRSRAPYRRKWGELSIAERIERVCGTRTDAHDERLTLVR